MAMKDPQHETGRSEADAAFAAALRDLLRDSEKQIDFRTAARLSAARARAVEEAGRPVRHALRWAVPFGSAIAVATMFAWLMLSRETIAPLAQPAATPQAEVLETIADDGDALGVYQDIEFYQWLAETNGRV
jgi:hypothetical protein